MAETGRARAEALYAEGVDAVARGDAGAAIDAFRRALDADPEMADSWEALSMALADAERWEEAIAAAKRAVELQPDEELPRWRGRLQSMASLRTQAAVSSGRSGSRSRNSSSVSPTSLPARLSRRNSW